MHYIFGFGSLINRESRTRTTPSAELAYPVIVKGIRRSWELQQDGPGFGTTFLGAQQKAGISCNGVIYPVNEAELKKTDEREVGYLRQHLLMRDITMLNDEFQPPQGEIWVYLTGTEIKLPNEKFPIVQSYVDICLNGCFEIEEEFPKAKEIGFAEYFIKSTNGWSKHWVNDRIHPRRPHIYTPNARKIDSFLNSYLPDFFSSIRIE